MLPGQILQTCRFFGFRSKFSSLPRSVNRIVKRCCDLDTALRVPRCCRLIQLRPLTHIRSPRTSDSCIHRTDHIPAISQSGTLMISKSRDFLRLKQPLCRRELFGNYFSPGQRSDFRAILLKATAKPQLASRSSGSSTRTTSPIILTQSLRPSSVLRNRIDRLMHAPTTGRLRVSTKTPPSLMLRLRPLAWRLVPFLATQSNFTGACIGYLKWILALVSNIPPRFW
jgi:hypothetical protein